MADYPPSLRNEASRFNTRPPKPGGPTDDDRAEVLLYLPISRAEDKSSAWNALFQSSLGDKCAKFIDKRAIGRSYPAKQGNSDTPPGTRVFGNDAARNLLREFDDLIDYTKRLEKGEKGGQVEKGEQADKGKKVEGKGEQDSSSLYQKFVDAYGPELTANKDLGTLIDLAIRWSEGELTVRLRNLAYYITRDTTTSYNDKARKENLIRRENINRAVHRGRIEYDVLWILSTHGHVGRRGPEFRGLKGLAEVSFESLYRVTVDQAATIVRLALETNAKGDLTENGRLFNHVIYIINSYQSWRDQVLDLYDRTVNPPSDWNRDIIGRIRAYRQEQWKARGGLEVDLTYEAYLDHVFRIVHMIQSNLKPTLSDMEAYHRQKNHFIETVKSSYGKIYTLRELEIAFNMPLAILRKEEGIMGKPVSANKLPQLDISLDWVPLPPPLEYPRKDLPEKTEWTHTTIDRNLKRSVKPKDLARPPPVGRSAIERTLSDTPVSMMARGVHWVDDSPPDSEEEEYGIATSRGSGPRRDLDDDAAALGIDTSVSYWGPSERGSQRKRTAADDYEYTAPTPKRLRRTAF
ncbi:hypothetical protein F4677DRAFT_140883 [Hypoxylon crocopeplum]|nr:hypothetical protein F4677DRAFT_140883 [Hypoxylon crocopeplum]